MTHSSFTIGWKSLTFLARTWPCSNGSTSLLMISSIRCGGWSRRLNCQGEDCCQSQTARSCSSRRVVYFWVLCRTLHLWVCERYSGLYSSCPPSWFGPQENRSPCLSCDSRWHVVGLLDCWSTSVLKCRLGRYVVTHLELRAVLVAESLYYPSKSLRVRDASACCEHIDFPAQMFDCDASDWILGCAQFLSHLLFLSLRVLVKFANTRVSIP